MGLDPVPLPDSGRLSASLHEWTEDRPAIAPRKLREGLGGRASGDGAMQRSENEDGRRIRGRAWVLALLAAAAWVGLLARAAEAQTQRVPDVVLAQVLGAGAVASAKTARGEQAAPVAPEASAEALVAHRMRASFQDQLVAGVTRPSVELEVHFDFDSAEIHRDSHGQIAAAATVLSEHFPTTRFRVAGYTDAAGAAEYNQALSERRADAVWTMLVEEHGVEAARLERVGFGEDGDQGADGDAPAIDAQRRRVELQILRDGGA